MKPHHTSPVRCTHLLFGSVQLDGLRLRPVEDELPLLEHTFGLGRARTCVDHRQIPDSLGPLAPEVDRHEGPPVEAAAGDVPGPLEQQRGGGAGGRRQQDAQVAAGHVGQRHLALDVFQEVDCLTRVAARRDRHRDSQLTAVLARNHSVKERGWGEIRGRDSMVSWRGGGGRAREPDAGRGRYGGGGERKGKELGAV